MSKWTSYLRRKHAGSHVECSNGEADERIDLAEDDVGVERPTCEALDQHHRQARAGDQNQTDEHTNENR